MDRRLFAFVACLALVVGAVGFVLAQNQSSGTQVEASGATLLPPQEPTTTTTTQPESSETTIRSTLPATAISELFDYAAGSGCTPGGNRLPDGEFYGSVIVNDDRTFMFNLKCLFLAEDLPANFDELFTDRFPGQEFPATGFDLVDVAATERVVRFAWDGELTLDGALYVGDEAYQGFVNRNGDAFDAVIVLDEGIAVSVDEIVAG